jgi:hypothetical protein
VRTETVRRTGKASGKGELRSGGGVHIKKGKDGVAAEAKAIEEMKRNMDGAPVRTRAVTKAYRDGWERTFGRKE